MCWWPWSRLAAAELAQGREHASAVRQLLDQLVQSLHMMLQTLADAARSAEPEDLALLRALTHDRSELMDDIRRRRLGSDLDAGLQQAVFTATSVFERCIWLARRYVLLLDAPASRPAPRP